MQSSDARVAVLHAARSWFVTVGVWPLALCLDVPCPMCNSEMGAWEFLRDLTPLSLISTPEEDEVAISPHESYGCASSQLGVCRSVGHVSVF